MKQIISLYMFCIMSASPWFARLVAQNGAVNQGNPNAFKVIDMKINSSNYLIVTSRDDFGRTFQFYTGKSDPISLGLTTLPDFDRGTVSPENNKNSNYVILKPFFLNQCCSVSKMEQPSDTRVDFVIAKEDTANGFTYFNKNFSADVILKINQPIYQKVFNNKRFAVLKPLNEGELNKNLFYSYELKFMTHESYSSLRKNVRGQTVISNNRDSVKAEIKVGKTLQNDNTTSKTAKTQKLNNNDDLISKAPPIQKLSTDTNSVSNNKPVADLIIPKEKTDTAIAPEKQDSISTLPAINAGHTEISDIMFGKNMATGILQIDVPADVEYTINIYSSTDHTLLFNSNEQRSFSLLPGTYDIEISGMSLTNIPVYKAMNTRIRAGVLSITSGTPWTLYDKNKVKAIYSASQPKKLELPAGIYQLEINGSIDQIEITDGQLMDYNNRPKTPVQIQEPGITDSAKNKIAEPAVIKIAEPAVINTLPGDKKWEIKPGTSARGANGKVLLTIPKEIECIISITQPRTEKEVHYSGILTKERSFSLPAGNYDVKISGYIIKNVPVQKGMDTRIKAGILNVTATGIWTLYDEKKDKQVYFSTTQKKIGLPAGAYQIDVNGTVTPIIIKDRETVKF